MRGEDQNGQPSERKLKRNWTIKVIFGIIMGRMQDYYFILRIKAMMNIVIQFIKKKKSI